MRLLAWIYGVGACVIASDVLLHPSTEVWINVLGAVSAGTFLALSLAFWRAGRAQARRRRVPPLGRRCVERGKDGSEVWHP